MINGVITLYSSLRIARGFPKSIPGEKLVPFSPASNAPTEDPEIPNKLKMIEGIVTAIGKIQRLIHLEFGRFDFEPASPAVLAALNKYELDVIR